MTSTEAYYGLNVFLTTLTAIFPVWRFYLLRKKKRDTVFLTSDCLFILGSLIATFNAAVMSHGQKEVATIAKTSLSQQETFEEFFTEMRLKLYFTIATIAFIVNLWVLKGAFLLFYWTLFRRAPTANRIGIWATTVLVPVFFIVSMVVYLVECPNLSESWSPLGSIETPCVPSLRMKVVNITNGSHLLSDLMLFVLPFQVLGALKLSRPEKWALIFAFAMGMASIASAAARWAVLHARGIHTIHRGLTLEDANLLSTLSISEMLAAIIAFCSPAMKHILTRSLAFPPNSGYTTRPRKLAGKSTTHDNASTASLVAKGYIPRSRIGVETDIHITSYSLSEVNRMDEFNGPYA